MLRAALFVFPAWSLGPSCPNSGSVLGHKPGDDFYLASYDDARACYQKLAASSKRIKLIKQWAWLKQP